MTADLQPSECHLFSLRGGSVVYPLAHGRIDRTIAGITYGATYAAGGPIQQQTNALKNQTWVRMAWEEPFAWQYRLCPPDGIYDYIRYRWDGAAWVSIFRGEVCGVRFHQDDRTGRRYAEVSMQPLSAVAGAGTLCQRYSRQCGVPLYSAPCGVDRDDYLVTGMADTVSGNLITSSDLAALPIAALRGGDILIAGRRRKIVSHDGASIRIASFIPRLAAGQAFRAWYGCDHSKSVCVHVFANGDNYRGQEFAPDQDPWTGGLG